jgi:hypothetical protein
MVSMLEISTIEELRHGAPYLVPADPYLHFLYPRAARVGNVLRGTGKLWSAKILIRRKTPSVFRPKLICSLWSIGMNELRITIVSGSIIFLRSDGKTVCPWIANFYSKVKHPNLGLFLSNNVAVKSVISLPRKLSFVIRLLILLEIFYRY